MESLIGKTLKTNDYNDIETSSLQTQKIFCLYFSGSFCAPCKKFTSFLQMFYEEINADEEELEIILIPADENETEFKSKQITFRLFQINALEVSPIFGRKNKG
jgi:nucleoredoxin